MSYNEKLADRVREVISRTQKKIEEKKMFGGLCFMVNDKMCVGVESERLMLRIDPIKVDEVIKLEGCIPMDFTGKVMKGFVFVEIAALNTRTSLDFWIDLAIQYNKIAKPSKKKSTKPKTKTKSKQKNKSKVNKVAKKKSKVKRKSK